VSLSNPNLDNYGAILAPFTPDINVEQIAKLTEYVRTGGLLFADIGFGCIQAGKVVTGMTNKGKHLFGIEALKASAAKPGRFTATGMFSKILEGLKKDVDSTENLHRMALDVEPATAVAALRGLGG
jgi:hypothetical protein